MNVVLQVLEEQKAEYRQMLGRSDNREDDMPDIETDICHLKSVERGLYDNVKN